MFIVKQKINGKDYYYLRKSVREGSKVKSEYVAYLGKDKEEAEKKAKEIIEKVKNGENISNLKKELIISSESFDSENSNNATGAEEQKKLTIEEKASSITIEEKASSITIEELANFCKEKGFVFRSSELYGGFAGFWDFGPLGVELFNNIKKDFWNFFVTSRDNMVGIEASIISHPRTWIASGHVANFSDVAVVCKKCNKATKIDKSEVGKVNCDCGGEYDIKGEFSLMFKTKVGAIDAEEAYLRGETAQGMFMDFKLVQQTSRMQLPFGILQIGRCFRNEIAPRDFLFRSREFHIGEFEFFINPEEKKCDLLMDVHKELKIKLLDGETQMRISSLSKDNENSKVAGEPENILRETTIGEMLSEGRLDEWHAYWLAEQIFWYNSVGLREIKIREHKKDELSHYSSATFDIDYEYVFGSKELGGIANRGQYDLTQHAKESKQNLEVFDEKYKNKVIPRVIEPTFGMERAFLAILTKAYNYDKKRDNVVLKLPAKLAPIKAAVFPIIKSPEYNSIAEDIVRDLRKEWNVSYDKSGSLGRRYARNDSVGTPFCITIDENSLKDKDCTIRDRDTTVQIRVKLKDLKETLKKLIGNEMEFKKAGKIVETRVKEN
jgi:glycyl-tRNA synthetase